MAFTGITATEAEIDQKSGANVSTSFTDTMKTQALLQAESLLNVRTKFNWSDAFLTLDADVKYFVTLVTSSKVAMEAIKYDMGDFNSRGEAVDMINILDADVKMGLQILKRESATNVLSRGIMAHDFKRFPELTNNQLQFTTGKSS